MSGPMNGSDRPLWMPEKVPERVAIVALGPSHQQYVPVCDRYGNRFQLFDETWTVNSFANVIDSDRLFHMDDFRVQMLRAVKNERVRNMLESLKRYKGPIYTSVEHPDYPQSRQFPLFEAISKYNTFYFNNTMAYALAFAGLIGVKQLTLFGMDYTWPGVEGSEGGRGCAEYWVGRLRQSGVGVAVCQESTLLDTRQNRNDEYHLYGYDAYTLKLERQTDGKVKLRLLDKPLPTAEEIEIRYFGKRPAELQAILGGEAQPPRSDEQGKHVRERSAEADLQRDSDSGSSGQRCDESTNESKGHSTHS